MCKHVFNPFRKKLVVIVTGVVKVQLVIAEVVVLVVVVEGIN